MAENKQPTDIPQFPEDDEEVDLLFRAEMKVRDLMLGYWKHGLLALGLVLIASLFVGLWRGYAQGAAREGSAALAAIDRDQPEPDQLALMGLKPLDDPADTERMKLLADLAARYEAAARDTRGASASAGLLKAADSWRRAGNDEEAGRLYKELAGESGVFGVAGLNGMAAIALEAGKPDEALVSLRKLADSSKGIHAEYALMDMLRVETDRGNTAAAAALVEEFKLRFGNSPRMMEVLEIAGETITVDAGAAGEPAGEAPAGEAPSGG